MKTNTTVTVVTVPDDGYKINRVLINGTSYTVDTSGKCAFTVTGNTTVNVVSEPTPASITAVASYAGSISPATQGAITVCIDGYSIASYVANVSGAAIATSGAAIYTAGDDVIKFNEDLISSNTLAATATILDLSLLDSNGGIYFVTEEYIAVMLTTFTGVTEVVLPGTSSMAGAMNGGIPLPTQNGIMQKLGGNRTITLSFRN